MSAVKEDVYETGDLPETDQHAMEDKSSETFESEHIERIQLDVGGAFQRFKGHALNTNSVDFSDSLSRNRLCGYGGGHYVFEMVGPDHGGFETAVQRYNRLSQEINELSGQLEELKKASGEDTPSISAEDVTDLQAQLKKLQIEQIINRESTIGGTADAGLARKIQTTVEQLKHKKSTIPSKKTEGKATDEQSITYEMTVPDATALDASKVTELDRRLNKIEQLIGTDVETLHAVTGGGDGGLLAAVESLDEKMRLIESGGHHIEGLDTRLAALLQKLNQVKEVQQKHVDEDDVGKVTELFDLMKKWDVQCSGLPAIASRLQSLQQLHEQAMQFSQALAQLDGVQQQLSKTITTDSSLLSEVRESLSKNSEAILTNCNKLEERINALK